MVFTLRDSLSNYLQQNNWPVTINVNGNNMNIVEYFFYTLDYNIVHLFLTKTEEEYIPECDYDYYEYYKYISNIEFEVTLVENINENMMNDLNFIEMFFGDAITLSFGTLGNEIEINLTNFMNSLETDEQQQQIIKELIYIFNGTVNKQNNVLYLENIFIHNNDNFIIVNGEIIIDENIAIKNVHKSFEKLKDNESVILEINNLDQVFLDTDSLNTIYTVYDLEIEYVY